jgi:hypothetical protein
MSEVQTGSLSFIDLLREAEDAYGDGICTLSNAFDLKTGLPLPACDVVGDLSTFICHELFETFDAKAVRHEQLKEAQRVMNTAADQLISIAALMAMLQRR